MKQRRSTLQVDRFNRRPFHVRVLTEPGIPRCWSVNLSETGIGLIGCPRPGDAPREGDQLELEFSLIDSGEVVRALGEVRWRHDAPGTMETATSSLGVHFLAFEGEGRLHLMRYLEGMQVRVAVAYADDATEQLVRDAIGDLVELEFGAEHREVEFILGRGDVSALVVCGDDPVPAMLLAELAAAVSEDNLTFEGRPRDLAARLIYCAPAQTEHLVQLFNEGKIFRRLLPPIDAASLRTAVVAACREHALRLEQERLTMELDRNLHRERALREPAPAPEVEARPGLTSRPMRAVVEQLRIAAPHKVSVLLQGETGSGKEVLARLTHQLSDRRDGPFVVQDCGTLTPTLLESELFGHVKGAFTGAVADHPGLFLLADGGTVFLDEVENTTPELQAKLLRVLETGEVRPVGGPLTRRVDVRLVTASNRVLAEEVRQGRFRADLFYRLNTFTLDVPPLREREDDVLPLARHFLDLANHQLKKRVLGFSTAAERSLRAAPWPGNVRELRNVIERATLLAKSGGVIELAHLPLTGPSPVATAGGAGLRGHLSSTERELIRGALARNGQVLRRAARDLGMDPATLGRRAKKLGLWPPAAS